MPLILLHLVQRLRSKHETIVLFTAITEHHPVVEEAQRLRVESLDHGMVRVVAHCGFFETPDVVGAMAQAKARVSSASTSRGPRIRRQGEVRRGTGGTHERVHRRHLLVLSRNARNATLYFGVPPEQVVEVGMRMDL